MRTNKNTSKIILAVIVALLATMISYSSFTGMKNQMSEQQKLIDLMQNTKNSTYKEKYAYAIAKGNLLAGELVSDEEVDFKQFEVEDSTAFQNRSDVVNKVLLKDISEGELFSTAHIAKVSNDDVSLKEGFRALTLPAENFQGKSNKMLVGSNVDIYSASKDTDWCMEDVKILSFESSQGVSAGSGVPSADINSATGITFEVAANDISDFITNVSRSKLVLVARNQNDRKVLHKKSNSQTSPRNYGAGSLPSLPPSVPISNLPGEGLSGLPQPLTPEVQPPSVELIEANVKSKVTFD